MFFRVLPKICLSLIPTERGRFSRCFPKYSQFLYISSGREPFLSGFQISPQRVATEKGQKVRFWWNFFSLLIPSEKSHLAGCFQKISLPKSSQRETRFFTSVLNISSLVPTGSGQKLCLFCNFLPSRGRSRERLKIKPFEKNIFLPSIGRQRGWSKTAPLP